MPNAIPLLILSDSVSAQTGLARITRDLALRIHCSIPEFRLGTVGYGGSGDRNLPFPQYYANVQDWIPLDLPAIWQNFTGGEPGILFVIWDAARVGWLGQYDNPELNCPISDWYRMMRKKKFIKTWLYPPMDAAGPNGKLSTPLKQTLLGFDRVLAYSSWANGVIRASGIDNTEALPHGIDGNVWAPRNRERSRMRLKLRDEDLFLGIVATNQARKDWALGIRTAAYLRDELGKSVALWLHTDALERFWSIPVLLLDYGFTNGSESRVMLTTGDLSDGAMAEMYSACDVTLGIGKGEGFGYPLFESLACGTPVCAHYYSGYAEHIPEWMMVDPDAYYYDGLYCEYRPIGQPKIWAEHIAEYSREFSGIELPKHLEWNTLFPRWKDWLLRGIK